MLRNLNIHKANPVMLLQVSLGGLLNVIEKRADLLLSGDEFSVKQLLYPKEKKLFCNPEFGRDINDILLATRKYVMISNNGCQRYKKI